MNRDELTKAVETIINHVYCLPDVLPELVVAIRAFDVAAWRSLLADAALGAAVRKVVEGDDPQPAELMAQEVREYAVDGGDICVDSFAANVLLAIADALKKEGEDARERS